MLSLKDGIKRVVTTSQKNKVAILFGREDKGLSNRDLETRIMRNLKHLIGRAGLTDWELRMLHGICSQIERKIKGES